MRTLSKYWVLIFIAFCVITVAVNIDNFDAGVKYQKVNEPAKPQYRFTLIEAKGQVERLFDYDSVTITGKVKNNTNKNYSYVQITFNLYDKDDNLVGTAMDNINNLEANGTWIFNAIGMGKNLSLIHI